MPARYRGWTDLLINGSFWIGAALGAGGSIVLLNPALLPPDLGWRAAFFIGSVLGLFILVMRSWISESPRWLMIHGRPEEAHEVLNAIEDAHRRRGHHLPDEELATLRLRPRYFTPLHEVWEALFSTYPKRTFVSLSLMVAQAFFYNAIFFTYALVSPTSTTSSLAWSAGISCLSPLATFLALCCSGASSTPLADVP